MLIVIATLCAHHAVGIIIPQKHIDNICDAVLAGPHNTAASLAWCGERPYKSQPPPSPSPPTSTPNPASNSFYTTYTADYVIVGAGTAGALLAKRLAVALPHRTVILVSSGGSPVGKPDTAVELYSFELAGQSPHIYLTADKYTRDPVNYYYPEPILNGGASGVNGGTIVKPPIGWFDLLSSLGFPSWGFSSMRDIANSFENFTGPDPYHSHGHNGEIIITAPPPETLTTIISQCLSQIINKPVLPDIDNFTIGIGPAGRTIDEAGNRQNSYLRTISPLLAAGQSNLVVLEHHRCTRVLFAPAAPMSAARQVNGLACLDEANNVAVRVTVNKEVILTADALGNVKILERSGVGNCSFLATLGIPCVVNNDQVGAGLMSSYNVPAFAYLAYAGGPAVHNNGNVNLGYFASAVERALGYGLTDLQPGFAYLAPDIYIGLLYQHRYTSRGSVHLKSADVTNNEVVYTNLFSDPRDIEPMMELINVTRQMFACANANGLPNIEISPGLAALPNDAAAWQTFITTQGGEVYHHQGTHAMGKVVDEFQRVYNTIGLRAVGGGSVPSQAQIPTHYSMGFAFLSAAKAAADILSNPNA